MEWGHETRLLIWPKYNGCCFSLARKRNSWFSCVRGFSLSWSTHFDCVCVVVQCCPVFKFHFLFVYSFMTLTKLKWNLSKQYNNQGFNIEPSHIIDLLCLYKMWIHTVSPETSPGFKKEIYTFKRNFHRSFLKDFNSWLDLCWIFLLLLTPW